MSSWIRNEKCPPCGFQRELAADNFIKLLVDKFGVLKENVQCSFHRLEVLRVLQKRNRRYQRLSKALFMFSQKENR
jgi:hypothetical protein